MANATMTTFGWPETKIAELDHWVVALRPQQPTLGAVVVVCKEPVQAFGEVSPEGFAEFGRVVKAVESMLATVVAYEKINWLMLMMVDPDVHFHVIPRYDGERTIGDLTKADAGWPKQPALGDVIAPEGDARSALREALRAAWSA